MARKSKPARNGFVLFDVVYQDGTRTSNRKVPCAEDGMSMDDALVRAAIESQDRDIAVRSGVTRGPIKSLSRSLRH